MGNQIFTKKEHYVPKCYLKHFAIREANKYFSFCFFRNTSTMKKINIEHICVVNDLYEFILIDEYVDRNAIEKGFVDIESKYAILCDDLLSCVSQMDEIHLTIKNLETLKIFLSLLIFRSKAMVEGVSKVITEYIIHRGCEYETIRKLIPNMDEKMFNEEWKPFLDEEIGLSLAHHFLKETLDPHSPSITVRAFMEMIGENYCFLYDKNACFVTSDMPVVHIRGTYSHDDIEYNAIGMPLSPCVYVVFFDEGEEYNHKIIKLDSLQVKKINDCQLLPNNKIIIANDLENIENLIG